jgi:pimeloyl-ACP methyl ester carboxylesterase
MPVAQVGEIGLWYADQGLKESPRLPMLLLHGAGGSHLDWPATLRRLPDRRVIVPDLPGHGRSAPPWRDSIGAYAGDVMGLLDRLGFGRCILVGHSMGGAIALSVAHMRPQCVAGLILIGCGARLPVPAAILDGLVVEPQRALAEFGARLGTSGAGPSSFSAGPGLGAIDPAVLRADLLACGRFDATGWLGELSMPALVVVGRGDRVTPVALGEDLAGRMGAATLVVMEGGGHFVALEQPSRVGEVVRGWLAGVDPG